MQMPVNQWLDIIHKEYLDSFIADGGAAVKFAVLLEKHKQEELFTKLDFSARKARFLLVRIDSTQIKIHMMDKLFHAIAQSVDWNDLTYRFLRRFLENNDNIIYKLPENKDDLNIVQLAELNHSEPNLIRRDIYSYLVKWIWKDYAMSQEYRIAMIQLCKYTLDPDDNRYMILAQNIKDWLTGELRFISALKDAPIFQKIARHNARHMLYSFSHWLGMSGQAGLLLCLDISRYLINAKRIDQTEGNYYSPAAVLDAYEVLRQFIDGTDEMERVLTIVIAPNDFLSDEKRGVDRYDALKLRIMDEVRDNNRANPFASLVRLCHECPADAIKN